MGIFIFLPRIVMNNSTRNFTNSSNTQNSSSLKDKLRKLTTGVALAGTLMVGNPSCTSCSHEKNIDQEAKTENVEVKTEVVVTPDNQDSELSDIDFDKEAEMLNYEFEDMQIKADSIANLEEAKRIEAERKQLSADIDQLATENKQLAAENKQLAAEKKQLAADIEKEREKIKQIWIEIEREFSTVTQEDIRKSKDLQKQLVEYIERCKKTGKHKPGKHVQSLMASIKK